MVPRTRGLRPWLRIWRPCRGWNPDPPPV